MLLNACMHRHIGRRPMMLRPIELHAAGDPRTQQSHEGRLDDMLAIEEVVSVGFVEPGVNAAADFRKNHQLDKFVLKHDGAVGLVLLLKRHAVSKRIGINLAAAALVNALLQEHGIRISVLDRVGWNDDLFFPTADRFKFVRSTHQIRTSPLSTWPHAWVLITHEHGHGSFAFTLTYTYIHPLSMTQRTAPAAATEVPTSLADIVAGRITVLFLQPLDRRSFGRSGGPLANPVVNHGQAVVRRKKVGVNFDGPI